MRAHLQSAIVHPIRRSNAAVLLYWLGGLACLSAGSSVLCPARSVAAEQEEVSSDSAVSVTDPALIPELLPPGRVASAPAASADPAVPTAQEGQEVPDEEEGPPPSEGNTIFREIGLPQHPPQLASTEEDNEQGKEGPSGPWGVSYFGIFYGPSVLEPSLYQPSETRTQDLTRPILLKNLLTLSYALSEEVAISGTGFWSNEPVQARGFTVRDPYLRLSHNALVQSDVWSLYGDVRVHFPVTHESRQADLLTAVQTFESLSAQATEELRLALWASQRANYFGKQGFGNDLELYFAPNLEYAVSDTLAFTLVYEVGTSHFFGEPAFSFSGDGSDVQPGISWSPSPSLNLSPYLNIPTTRSLNLRSTSFGMTLLLRIL